MPEIVPFDQGERLKLSSLSDAVGVRQQSICAMKLMKLITAGQSLSPQKLIFLPINKNGNASGIPANLQ